MKQPKGWDRLLWAVEFGSLRDSKLIPGDAWHGFREPMYDGEVSRCLLFNTRRQARAWCADANKLHRKHSPDWSFKPIRVRETVCPAGR